MASRDVNISTRVETAEVPFPLTRIDGSICVDDFLPYTNLSIERALRLIPLEDDPESHRNLYAWFMNETGNEGIRFHGSTLPGVKFKHVAQRGIHVPSRHRYAATVTVAYNSLYSDNNDGARVDLGDGTWILYYSAHQNNSGGTTDMHWNQKLVNCLMDGVPVGVFLQQNSSSSSYLRFLAFVEEFNPENELFTLHGPVTPETEHLFASATPQAEMEESATVDENLQTDEISDPESMEEDRRRFSVARRMVRQGQQTFRKDLFKAYEGHCAVTGFDTNEVLQAAHSLITAVPKAILWRMAFCYAPIFTCCLIAIYWALTLPQCAWRQVRGFRTGSTQISMARSCFCLKRKPCVRTRISLSRNINVLSVAFDPDRAPRHSS